MECSEGVVVAERYRLVRKLGAGGMGAVWLAHDLALDSSCALKLIDEEKSQSGEVRLRFEREARAAAQLRGAHVVDVFDHGEWNNVLYIAMEYLEGEDLGARLDRVGPLEPEAAYRIVAHVARALARAHAHGIVHRDLKPENIFLVEGDEGEIAKVLDFGIAKHDAYSLQDKATRTGSFLGTPYYVSPEQARGKSTDHRSDLWSLGIIAFQCLTGRPPFESDALGELMGLILYEDLPRPTLRNANLPLAIDAWWERAAARDREQRFQTAKELADSLGIALGLTTVVAVPTISPRRPSYADGSGSFPPIGASGSLTPPGLPRGLTTPSRTAGRSHLGESASLEELVDTDAPVSRTRHSGLVVSRAFPWPASWKLPEWISDGGAEALVERIREQRKRTLIALAIGSGIAVGALLTLLLLGNSEDPRVSPNVSAAQAPLEEPSPLPPAPSAVVPQRPSPPQATQTPVPIEALPTQDADAPAASASSTEAKRKAPPKRKVTRGPDYGI